ncbi:MAG TPA: hypothetical protein H9755_16530 [Candidatus Dietzia intestinigallinarum]|nr:hypothetical protein [Candidatus Dietzia intestinigallinarum]
MPTIVPQNSDSAGWVKVLVVVVLSRSPTAGQSARGARRAVTSAGSILAT